MTRKRQRPGLRSLLATASLSVACARHGTSTNDSALGPQALFNLGLDAAKQARIFDARTAFEAVIRLEPSHSGALHSLGNIAVIEGDHDLAAEYHGLAKAADPQQLPPLAVLHQQKVPCAGLSDTYWVSSFAKKRLHDHPNDSDTRFDVHVSMGTQLEDSGLVELAMLNFQHAAALRPGSVELRLRNALMVPVIYDNTSHVHDSRALLLAEVTRLLTQASSGSLPPLQRLDQLALPGTFYLVYQGFNDAELMQDIHAVYRLLYPRLSPPPPPPPPPSQDSLTTSSSTGKLRVGFVSAYLRRHSVGKLFAGIIQRLPRHGMDVVVFSSTPSPDDVTRNLASSRARVVEMPRGFLLSNKEVVVQERLDVLVYLDIGMDTHTTMWAADRLAPVQVATWGHPVTTGLPHMDYFVSSDAYEGLDGSDRFTEQLVRLSSLGFSFTDPSPTGRLPHDRVASFLTRHGLPHDRPIIGCPQSLPKFHPSLDTALSSILQALPSALLVLLYPPDKTVWKDRLHHRLLRQLHDPGQVVFLPSLSASDFLSLQQASMLVLDPYPFGGGVTTLEALAVCTPVLTLPSRQTVPRLAAGMLQQGLGGSMMAAEWLVAEDEDDFVRRAVQVVGNHTLHASLSHDICLHKHRLFSSSRSGGKAAAAEWAAFLARAAGRGQRAAVAVTQR